MKVNLSESILNSIKESDDMKFRYSLLGRLQSDCEYFLGHGLRNEKDLWAGNVEKQIAKMRELYNSFADEDKPEWLTAEQIDEYERRMLSDEDNGEEYHVENPTVIEDINKLHEDNNMDLPEGYDQEVYDAYFAYCNEFDGIEEEPLDFNDWYNANNKEA